VRILDLSRVLAAPWCVQNLADMGADVIKIERPGPGDESRHWGPPWLNGPDGKPTRESAYFMSTNRNKRSAAIDLANPQGQAIIRTLAEQADICIENFKVGDLARYGLDYASLSKVNPRLIYCSVTGFGQDAPGRRPVRLPVQGMGGLMSVTGERDDLAGGGPQKVGVAVADLFTGMYATVAILAALPSQCHRRGRETHDGRGAGDELRQLSNFMIGGSCRSVLAMRRPTSPIWRVPVLGGLFIVASANQGQFSALCNALGHPEWIADPRFKDNGARMAHQSELHTLFSQILSTKPRAHWESLFLEVGVPAGPINDYQQAMAHPQVQHLKTRIGIPHATGVEAPGIANPMRFSKSPVTYRRPPPMLGQHTQEVLQELGLDQAAIDALVKAGAVKFG
jgi:crotonobetainyl-CoA:carnitine CoA-transferase CaiB-like acyl-CoA transferase